MDLRLAGKVAVVGGGTDGIGLATVRRFCEEGCRVVLYARRQARIDEAVAELSAGGADVRGVQADIRLSDDISRVFEVAASEFGAVDVVVNNDGAPPVGLSRSFSDEDWIAAFERNFFSVVRASRQALPFMNAPDGGSIVNVTALSVIQPIASNGLSIASWAAVLGFAKTLAIEVAADNIRVNTVCPGRIDTSRLALVRSQRAATLGIDEDELKSTSLRDIPMGRFGRPEEVADVIAFLSSPLSGFVTGATLHVDGGARKSLF